MTDRHEVARDERVEVGRHAAVLRRSLPVIVVLALAFAAAVYAVSRTQPPRYEATASVALLGVGEQDAGDSETVRRRLETVSALAAAPPVITETARRAGLSPQTVRDAVSAHVDAVTSVIDVTARAATAQQAAQVADIAAQVLLSVRKAVIEQSLSGPQAQLRTQLDQLEAGRNNGDAVDVMNSRLADLQVQAAVGGEDLRLLRVASVPAAPASPRPALNAFLGFVAAAIALSLAAVGRDAMRRPTAPIGAVEAAVGVPLVATLGRDGPDPAVRARDGVARLALEAWAARARVVVVAPGTPEVAGDVAVMRLGRAFADAGHDVLIVDADLAHPGLHRHYGLPLDGGVAEVLDGLAQNDGARVPALQRATRTVARPDRGRGHLAVLTAGEAVADPARLLTVERLTTLVRLLRDGQAEVVLINAPSVPDSAETWVLAREADALLVAVPADGLGAEEATGLADAVAALGAPTALLGVEAAERSWRARRPARPRRSGARVRPAWARAHPAVPLHPQLRVAEAAAPVEPVTEADRRR